MNTGNLALTLFERGWLQKKFVTACPNFCRSSRSEFLQEFPFQCETQQDFRQDRAKIWAAGYLFFGEIRDRIQRDFGCGDFCFSARILTGFTAGSRQDFDRRESGILPGIKTPVGKISPESRRDPAKIPVPILQGGVRKIPHNRLRFCYTYAQLIYCVHKCIFSRLSAGRCLGEQNLVPLCKVLE